MQHLTSVTHTCYKLTAMDETYMNALQAAQAELARLEKRRSVLLRIIEGLSELSEEERAELAPPEGYIPQGLTDEIRTILSLTTVHLVPTQIRDSLIVRGFRASSPKNLLVNVHTVLSRLHDARELDVIEKDGKPAYKMRTDIWHVDAIGKSDAEREALLHKPPRARTAPGSLAAQRFAEEDAKQRRK